MYMGTTLTSLEFKPEKLLRIIEINPGLAESVKPDLLLPPSGKNSIELPLRIRFRMC